MTELNLISLLRGAPLTILIALLRLGGTATTTRLMRITGYTQPTVTTACRKLIDAGVATNNAAGWVLVGVGLQMVLGEAATSKISLPSASSLLEGEETQQDIDAVVVGKISLLASVGVGEPLRTTIAAMHPQEYLQAHIDHWQKEKPRPSVRILIHRLRTKDPVPVDNSVDNPRKYVEGQFAEFIER